MIEAAYPDIRTVIGGKDCSGTFAHDLLKNIGSLDFVGTGECEVTVERLLNHIEDRSREIVNMGYRDSGGVIQESSARPRQQSG
jgi:hypothetical protein